MNDESGPSGALKRAIDVIGSKNDFAMRLGVSAQAISQWKTVPPLRVLQVEQLTGVPRHELRPDIYPAEVGQAAE